eukprot:10823911-Alexandrium_andersonii.AAC.1
MSASLVGSEMCIRDSAAHGTTHNSQCTIHKHHAPCTMHHAPCTIHNAPVSYTHLTLPTICSV